MNNDNNSTEDSYEKIAEAPTSKPYSLDSLDNLDALSQYIKSTKGTREGRAIPPLEKWHPEDIADMDLIIKANGEWWHEGGQMTRESLVSLFATILWKEENNGTTEYFLKTPVQKIRIQVEDAPLLINDVGIVHEDDMSWLEFTTTTGDVVRLDDEHSIVLKAYNSNKSDSNKSDFSESDFSESDFNNSDFSESDQANQMSTADDVADSQELASTEQVRPYMMVRNGLTALIGRNTFYHLTEIGALSEENGKTILTLQSGGQSYSLSMPTD
ncbi:DUF1285 domain-containing protein [Psychrobacter sp. NPDC078370]|uniref:DUF1285 domain-containing protein n=1 Tax=unclassified Psychrobacter TaxID=196806 RepID=UPI000C7EFD47|nr:DUF1285 domain-containing protein [Psychrobacter sp. MES7-P7E]PLT22107.1 DUF1285 domain-containing protein [Psychrobacter sp. MES7-P7E]